MNKFRILVTGCNGQIGSCLTQMSTTDYLMIGLTKTQLDITDKKQIKQIIEYYKPNIIVNAAAYTLVDLAEQEKQLALEINNEACISLAKACVDHHIPLLHISTDYVFDGKKNSPYNETDTPSPLNYYGISKLNGEMAIQKILPEHIILRVSGVFSAYKHNFVKTILRLAQEKQQLRIVQDQMICPTSANTIAETILVLIKLLLSNKNIHWGIFHYSSQETTNWYQFASAIINEAKKHIDIVTDEIIPITTDEYPTAAKRPRYSVLDCKKLRDVYGIESCSWQKTLPMIVQKLLSQ